LSHAVTFQEASCQATQILSIFLSSKELKYRKLEKGHEKATFILISKVKEER
jgi:hypothetical protein